MPVIPATELPRRAVFTETGTGSFTPSNNTIAKFVVNHYLPEKLGAVFGAWARNDTATVTFERSYAVSEGVIKGMEKQSEVKGLRVDLQEAQTHDGIQYACLQVQWGTGMKKNGGAYAGVLVRVDTPFLVSDIKEGLMKSFKATNSTYVKMDPQRQ